MVILLLKSLIPNEWKNLLSSEFDKTYFLKLSKELETEYKVHTIFPEKENIFKSISYCKPENIKVIILGQDPYIKQKQAHGLSFSVQNGVAFPKSLNNIFKELTDDIDVPYPQSGCLEKWAQQGVLLLNTILTVRENESNSHINLGWQNLTKRILELILETQTPKVFILWGSQAKQSFISAVNDEKYKMFLSSKDFQKLNNSIEYADNQTLVLTAPHPSPLSAYRGFFDSKPFSQTNDFLVKHGQTPIDWRLE